MNLAADVDELYRDLIARAEVYFRRRLRDQKESGRHEEAYNSMNRWLKDLEIVRTRELVERVIEPRETDDSGADVEVPL